jgi:farnesyl diphosphate synthase
MAGGQAIDLDSVGATLSVAELETMHRMKTGALIRAAVQLGAVCGRPLAAVDAAALDAFAGAAGLAFQVVDDVLDVEGSDASLGKTAGKDVAQGKPTFVSHLGLPAAKERAEALRVEARAALAPFGGAARRLAELADWIVLRAR